MDTKPSSSTRRSRAAVLLSTVLAFVFIVFVIQVLSVRAQGDGQLPERIPLNEASGLQEYLDAHTTRGSQATGDLSASSKTVNHATAPAGAGLAYQVVISNSDSTSALNLAMSDALPGSLAYVPGSLNVVVDSGFSEGYGSLGNVITWTGSLGPGGSAIISFSANLDGSLAPGTLVTNTAVIESPSTTLTRTATTTVISGTASGETYLPVTVKPLPILALTVNGPNSANQWTVSWMASNVDGYQLQEAQNAAFTGATTFDLTTASRPFDHDMTPDNVYFYRVRAHKDGEFGPWSSTVSVIGGYRDEFTNANTGWAIRRTTYIEEVRTWYEIDANKSWLIMQVEDSWDWGIASPGRMAPRLPYAIEYRSEPANLGNLVSHGAVFGGDWPGAICPDWSSPAGVYQHDLCFNHFYNTNIIWYGDLKLLFERVDYLEWLPNAGGSPMKRGSFDDYNSWFVVQPIPNVGDPNNWNTWRIEVRESGIKLFANGKLYAETNDNLWVNDPYFGVFASADEYSNSTWRYEYFEVRPLDS